MLPWGYGETAVPVGRWGAGAPMEMGVDAPMRRWEAERGESPQNLWPSAFVFFCCDDIKTKNDSQKEEFILA